MRIVQLHHHRSRGVAQYVRYFVVVSLLGAVGAPSASGGDFYVGLQGAVDRLGVLYDKALDGANLENGGLDTIGALRSEESASQIGYSYGFLAGYKVPLGISGVYVGLEGDMARHSGVAAGQLALTAAGAEDSPAADLVPQDWSLDYDRSFGLSARLGAGIPLIGTWVGPSVYVIAGFRRMGASFSTVYRDCADAAGCTSSFDESFNGWMYGAGIETKAGILAFRAEVKQTDYSQADRVISFREVFNNAPIAVDPDSLSFGVSVILYF